MQPDGIRRVILEASIEGCVIRGILIAPDGERRNFHGWLELNAALEAVVQINDDVDATTREMTP